MFLATHIYQSNQVHIYFLYILLSKQKGIV